MIKYALREVYHDKVCFARGLSGHISVRHFRIYVSLCAKVLNNLKFLKYEMMSPMLLAMRWRDSSSKTDHIINVSTTFDHFSGYRDKIGRPLPSLEYLYFIK
jgi:hypothetical protein